VFAKVVFGGTAGLIDGAPKQVLLQLVAACAAAAFGGLGTWVLVAAIDKVIGFRMSRQREIEGMDTGIHGEEGWMLGQVPAPSSEIAGSASVDLQVAHDRAREKLESGL